MCPRYFTENNDRLNAGFNALKSDACKKIIAMSDAAYQYQKSFLESHDVKNTEVILNKTITILPAQKPNIQSAIDKKLNPTKFIITAVASNGFFRKGGREIVNAMDYLIDKKFDIHLHLISNFDYGDYASKSTKDEWEIVMKKINKLSSHITCYRNISNEKVIELFKQSHLGLLPTYADSFGYSVLESQSCACPVLSTDVFALPEINNNEIGWLIEVEKHPNRNAIINTVEERLKFSKRLESGLIESISHIYQNTEELKTKSYKCLEHINVQHSPLKNAQVLEGFYNKILNL
jgi:glycosyltransferase involved in cell wall biosynthesis